MSKYIIIFWLYLAAMSSGQSITVTGFVFDSETRQAVSDATIYINNQYAAVSGEKGLYAIQLPAPGTYVISVNRIGYYPFNKSVTVKEDPRPLTIPLSPRILEGQSIEISTTRALMGQTPITFTNITRQEISENYTVSDIPMMLMDQPNVYSYSLTGDPLGYSFIKIRGFDQKRIGVMINDIPLNDPEDHQVYWVDMPDLAESVEDIQIQRGVGSSIYGVSNFGGSLNIRTRQLSDVNNIKAQYGYGSYSTRKFAVMYNSGIIQNKYSFHGRLSRITSDGFRKNSASDLWAYFLSAARYDENMITTINLYGGTERTHPDWDGIPEDILKYDRRYKVTTYRNDVDQFSQPHYELINEWNLTRDVLWKNSFYYIHGEGYYEGLKTAKDLYEYGMQSFTTPDPGLFGADSLAYYAAEDGKLVKNNGLFTVTATDLVRQKFVRKNQFGHISTIDHEDKSGKLTLGYSFYLFDSRHYGKVLWAKNMPALYHPDDNYYKHQGNNKSVNLFFNYLFNYSKRMKLLSNLLYEFRTRNFEQKPTANFSDDLVNSYSVDYHFISPRMGLNYTVNSSLDLYTNLSFARRAPSDDDLYDTWLGPDNIGVPPLFAKSDTLYQDGRITRVDWRNPLIKPEDLLDIELGINYRFPWLQGALNLYWMDFRNEIVAFGSRDADGNPIKGNAESTLHRGVEFSFGTAFSKYVSLTGNAAYSENFFNRFLQEEWDGSEKDLSGNTIAGFPDLLANLKLAGNYQDASASLMLQHVGRQQLDNTGLKSRSIDPFTVLNAMVSYRVSSFSGIPAFRAMFRVNNLLDARYETAGYFDDWSGTAYLYPAAGRNFYGALEIEL